MNQDDVMIGCKHPVQGQNSFINIHPQCDPGERVVCHDWFYEVATANSKLSKYFKPFNRVDVDYIQINCLQSLVQAENKSLVFNQFIDYKEKLANTIDMVTKEVIKAVIALESEVQTVQQYEKVLNVKIKQFKSFLYVLTNDEDGFKYSQFQQLQEKVRQNQEPHYPDWKEFSSALSIIINNINNKQFQPLKQQFEEKKKLYQDTYIIKLTKRLQYDKESHEDLKNILKLIDPQIRTQNAALEEIKQSLSQIIELEKAVKYY